ncbi:hypothetical protein [Streptomyces ehimensis]|uniref:Protein kinase domain-containing protein n=1 Tax=Streptomyces ehimensis TaxID=68195 RepID=A0ABV9BEQ3_9ACTN
MAEGAQAGDVVGDRYQLVQSTASGGMGRVWKAHDARLQTEVAVKERKTSSDLFSLGVTLHEAVEGVSPCLRDSWLASAHPPPPPRYG